MSKTPNKEEKNLFVSAILSNPGLSIKDREKVLMLLTRDMEDEIKTGIREIVAQEIESISRPKVSKTEKKTGPEWIHNPQMVNSFLLSFSSDKSPLKYSVHDWDAGEFDGYKYDVFISHMNDINKDERFLALYKCNLRLYFALKDYLLTSKKKQGEFYWDKDGKIKIGLQYPAGYAQKWMSENPGHQLWDMPLSYFPEEYQPVDLYGGRQLEYLGEVRDLFKHVIEFRDDYKVSGSLTADEMHILDRVLQRFGTMTAAEISEQSHREKGYMETSDMDLISYTYAIDME